jgi:ascorbate-specific PTS system EIIC-type component UlaA
MNSYITGRLFAKTIKGTIRNYVTFQVLKKTASEVSNNFPETKKLVSNVFEFSENHKLDPKTDEAITKNVFDCLQYVDQ